MISLEYLEKQIKLLNKQDDSDDKFASAVEEYCDCRVILCHPLSETFIEHLELLMQNGDTYFVDDMLQYWYYELEQGKNWKEGSVFIGGEDIKAETLEDVYNYYKNTYYKKG